MPKIESTISLLVLRPLIYETTQKTIAEFDLMLGWVVQFTLTLAHRVQIRLFDQENEEKLEIKLRNYETLNSINWDSFQNQMGNLLQN